MRLFVLSLHTQVCVSVSAHIVDQCVPSTPVMMGVVASLRMPERFTPLPEPPATAAAAAMAVRRPYSAPAMARVVAASAPALQAHSPVDSADTSEVASTAASESTGDSARSGPPSRPLTAPLVAHDALPPPPPPLPPRPDHQHHQQQLVADSASLRSLVQAAHQPEGAHQSALGITTSTAAKVTAAPAATTAPTATDALLSLPAAASLPDSPAIAAHRDASEVPARRRPGAVDSTAPLSLMLLLPLSTTHHADAAGGSSSRACR